MKKIFIVIILFFLTGCKIEENNNEQISKMFFKFNTYFTVQMNGSESQFNDIYEIFSVFDEACDYYTYSLGNLNDLNNNKEIIAKDDLLEVINFALELQSDGFNIFTGNINNLWKDYFNQITSSLPSEEEIDIELENIKNSSIEINDNSIKLLGDATIDLGAVAKGYAVLKVDEYIKENNITTFLINAGNSNLLLGYKDGNENYKVGVKNLYDGQYNKILSLNNKAVVTSSIESQSTTIDGVFYSHIIDPSTGYSNNYYDSITLIGDNSGLLDVLSTTFFNLSIEEIELLSTEYNIDTIVLKDDNVLFETKGVASYEENN